MNKTKSIRAATVTALFALIVVAFSLSYAYADSKAPDEAALMRGFKGKIELDTRDSKPDWTPFSCPNPLFSCRKRMRT